MVQESVIIRGLWFSEGDRRCSATPVKSLQGESQKSIYSEGILVVSGTLLSLEEHQKLKQTILKNYVPCTTQQKYNV